MERFLEFFFKTFVEKKKNLEKENEALVFEIIELRKQLHIKMEKSKKQIKNFK
jgi:hypothetical protein